MLGIDRVYVLADPVGRSDSGVSSYIRNAVRVLDEQGVQVNVITKHSNESIIEYRRRLAAQVGEIRKSGRKVVIEAPESDAATKDIPVGMAEIHIRLHCSRQLGAFVQGESICEESLALEQGEINRAHFISAPSRSAVVASKALFRLPENICCYPNPMPAWQVEVRPIDLQGYVLFLGRFHRLKGADWVLDLARKLPDIPFLMVGPEPDALHRRSVPNNLKVVDGAFKDKRELFSGARLVIIPSLYETASMVGIEALAMGVPIVAWRHLGIAEYAAAPSVVVVEPYKIDSFADSVLRGLECVMDARIQSGRIAFFDKLYSKGVYSVISGKYENFMPVKLNKNDEERIFSVINKAIEVPMFVSSNESKWRRKLRKLRRNPVLFFKDSWIGHLLIAPGKAKGLENKFSSSPSASITSVSKTPVFTRISNSGRIEFKTVPEKPKGLVSAFLYPESCSSDAEVIIEKMAAFDDFRCLQAPLLQIGIFEELKNGGANDLIDRIDVSNKKTISAVDHIILLNPPPVLVEALRSCGARQRIIVILNSKKSMSPDPWHTDVLIVVGKEHPAANTEYWRRKIVVEEMDHLSLAIRRAVQEGVSKSPDMLLPILGFDGNHRDEFLRRDVRFHQGIIHCSSGIELRGGTMAKICSDLSQVMTDLAVTESVYLRYRSLCDRIEDDEARKLFLSYSLYDGVIFDVRA